MWWYWTILIVSGIIGFGIGESYAFMKGGLTLSMYLWKMSEAWGPFEFLFGFFVGALGTHIYWHWMPPGASNVG